MFSILHTGFQGWMRDIICYRLLREKCPYSDFFWSVFSRILTEYEYLARMRENTGQKNSEYGHFLRNEFSVTKTGDP